MTGKIFDIKRFAIHDGDGIRTTVFLKGCPLKCVWCHNPEGISKETVLSYLSHKCGHCGECANLCDCHKMIEGKHIFYRTNCNNCGKCINGCINDALKIYGKEIDVDSLLPMLLEDKIFYEESGGGVTLSGGECLLQAEFCEELLMKLKKENIHTAVDTCGYVGKDAFDKVMPYTDIFLYDIKAIDEDVHIECTGRTNAIILENLKYIDKCGMKSEIRIPYVPNHNSNQIEKIGRFLSSINNITCVRVLPYHNFAGSKYEALDMKNTLPELLPEDAEIDSAKKILAAFDLPVA